MPTRFARLRAFPLLTALVLSAAPLCGCQSYMRSFTPGLQEDAHPFALQAASIGYSFMNGETVLWTNQLDETERVLLPFLEKVRTSGQSMRIAIEAKQADIEYYDVRLMFRPQGAVNPAEESSIQLPAV